MPTYDYVCDGCGHAFELFQSMTDSVKKTCPKCKKKKLRRLIGAGGAIVFKGSGFYKTDYRSESYKKGAAADSGEDGSLDRVIARFGAAGGEDDIARMSIDRSRQRIARGLNK